MRYEKLKGIFTLLLFICSIQIAHSQSFTPVTAVVQDSTGQQWFNGSYTAKLYNPSSTLPPVFTKTGAPVQTIYTGVFDNDGGLAVNLPDNMAISPAGSSWIFTLCSQTSQPCSTVPSRVLTGTSAVDLTSFFTSNIIPPSITGSSFDSAYSDAEFPTPVFSNIFVNTNQNTVEFYSQGDWYTLTPSSGQAGCVNNCVITNPTTTQIVTQPDTTYLDIEGLFSAGNLSLQNVNMGYLAGTLSNTGQNNVVIGASSLDNPSHSDTYAPIDEIAIGQDNLQEDTGGQNNIAIGQDAITIINPFTGYSNISLGAQFSALSSTSYQNIGIGSGALYNENGNNDIGIGTYAGFNDTDSNQFYLYTGDNPENNQADDRAYSLLWGTSSNTPGSLTGQQLTVNGYLTSNGGFKVTGNSTVVAGTNQLTIQELSSSLTIMDAWGQNSSTYGNIELQSVSSDGSLAHPNMLIGPSAIGSTELTSQSSNTSQIVTCAPGGTTTKYCDAVGNWIAPFVAPTFTGTSGYQKLSSGLIIQWAAGPVESANFSGTVSITFPETFPTGCLATQTGVGVTSVPTGNGNAYTAYPTGACSTTGVTVYMDVGPDGVGTVSHYATVIAIGY